MKFYLLGRPEIRCFLWAQWFKRNNVLALEWTLRGESRDTFLLSVGIPWLVTFTLGSDFVPPAWWLKLSGDDELAVYGLRADLELVRWRWRWNWTDAALNKGKEWKHFWNTGAKAVKSIEVRETDTFEYRQPAQTGYPESTHVVTAVFCTITTSWPSSWRSDEVSYGFDVKLDDPPRVPALKQGSYSTGPDGLFGIFLKMPGPIGNPIDYRTEIKRRYNEAVQKRRSGK